MINMMEYEFFRDSYKMAEREAAAAAAEARQTWLTN